MRDSPQGAARMHNEHIHSICKYIYKLYVVYICVNIIATQSGATL